MARLARNWGLGGLLIASFLCLLSFRIVDTPLYNTDDALYAAVAKNISQGGPWLPLEVQGNFYSGSKPPLFYWLGALSGSIFGFDEVGLRVLVFLFSLMGLIFFYFFLRKIGCDKLTSYTGIILLATSTLYFTFSRRFVMEVPAVSLLIGFLFAWVTLEKHPVRDTLLGLLLFTVYLMKNVLIVFPLAGLFSYFFIGSVSKERFIRCLRILGIFLASSVLWHLTTTWVTGINFLSMQLSDNFSALKGPIATQPSHPTFYLQYLATNDPLFFFLPIFSLLTYRQWTKPREESTKAFLLGWLLLGLAVLSFAGTHKERYLLSLYPALLSVGLIAFRTLNRKKLVIAVSCCLIWSILSFAVKFEKNTNPELQSYAEPHLREIIFKANNLGNPSRDFKLYFLDIYFAQGLFYSKRPIKEIVSSQGHYSILQANSFISKSNLVEHIDFLDIRDFFQRGKIQLAIISTSAFLQQARGWPVEIVEQVGPYLLLRNTGKPNLNPKLNWSATTLHTYMVKLVLDNNFTQLNNELLYYEEKYGRLSPTACVLKQFSAQLNPRTCMQGATPTELDDLAYLGDFLEKKGFAELANSFHIATQGT